MAERLGESDGPEIMVVLPRNAEGWLGQQTMDGARHRLLKLLWKADVHNRFRALHPVTTGGEPIYVHAKILIMDDSVLRVGSSNLNNRSLGFDSECDLAVEIRDHDATADEHRASIRHVRDRLLGEHLDVGTEGFTDALTKHNSLVATVDALRGEGKTLVEFDREAIDGEENPLAENELMDPEQAPSSLFQRTYRELARRRSVRRQSAHG